MAEEAGIPATLQAQMTANIAFDFLVSNPHSTSYQDFPSALYWCSLRGTVSLPLSIKANGSGCTNATLEYSLSWNAIDDRTLPS